MRNYRYITETADVERLLPILMQKPWQNHDSETTGLCPHRNKIILYQIGNKEQQYLIDTRTASLEPLRPYFESKELRKILHNAKFDYKMLRGSFNIEMEGIRCTMLTEQVLTAGKFYRGGVSLEDTLERRLGIKLDKTIQKSFIDHKGSFTKEQLDYAADDIIHLDDLFKDQVTEARQTGLVRTLVLESECVQAFGDMEFEGMVLDINGWKKIIEDNLSAQLDAQVELDVFSRPVMGENLFGEVNINYGSSSQVVKLLNDMGVKVPMKDPKTGKEILVKVTNSDAKSLKRVNHLPVIKALGKWRSYETLINTFGEPFIKALNPVTGRLHPDLFQIGTGTGRPAAGDSDVNPLNIPRDNRYRSCFTCEEDEVVESDDYSGCESRILADISDDKKLIEIFQRGDDIHCAVATELYGVPVTKKGENAKLRTPAKSLNFGIAYGMGPGRLYDELNAAGFPVSRDEARALFNKYCETYSGAVNYLRDMGKLARSQWYLANLNGRRRYWNKPDSSDSEKFPLGIKDMKFQGIIAKVEREGGNFLIQSVNADITKQAMIWIRDYIKQNKVRSKLMNAVYDEIVTRTHKDDSPEFHKKKLELMKKAAEVWIKKVPMEVDGAVGKFWQK